MVGDVNGRSYIVKGSFDNHFRRNRRFITRTKNTGFDVGEMLLEENVLVDKEMAYWNGLRRIQIVPPTNRIELANNVKMDNEVNEAELSAVDHDT